ncbi:hypothetical protein KCP78_23895 [Salmonella enterica subsp. enterica]|nr:hypothetical protein KCP78_23895 [Salmonella enterica subsp. enterica]
MLGPMVAACGGYVPMISGRGLGHTGGTLDKLEAIPVPISSDDNRFAKLFKTWVWRLLGKPARLRTSGQTFYATRDIITTTVDSIPLITGSISPEAAGAGCIFNGRQVGSGAFM